MTSSAKLVVDLTCSDDDDDDDVVVIDDSPPSAHQKFKSDVETSNATGESKKRKISDESSSPELEDTKVRRSLNPHQDDTTLPPSASASISCTENRVVLDDDGHDNGIVTYGLLEELDGLHLQNAQTCAGRRSQKEDGLSSSVQHIQQKDKWSCGFRNLQMLLTAVIPQLPADHVCFQIIPRRFPNPTVPSFRQIQRALEQSWQDGYDKSGAQHYRYKIVGKKEWIGAVEVSSVMSYWGLDSTVIQFISCRESREKLPKFVKAYFSKALGKEACPFCFGGSAPSFPSPLKSNPCAEELLRFASMAPKDLRMERECDCPLLPLYLQWEGHSIAVIGCHDDDILIFDPLKSGSPMKKELHSGKLPKTMKLPFKTLLSKDTQVVICSLCCLSDADKRSRRKEPSVITAAEDAVMRAVQASGG